LNTTRRRLIAATAGVLAMPALHSLAQAQGTFPSKPIRIIVPYPAGGQTDGIARSYGEVLSRKLGQPVVVENKGGASGSIGGAEVKRAPPDGYTILCTISSALIQNRVTIKDLPYDPEKDFTYLTMTTSTGGPVVVAEKIGATNLKQFVEWAQKRDKINWGAYGIGSTPHVLIATMAKQYGLKVEVVQYRGEAAMFADLAAGVLDGASGSPAGAAPVIASGKGKVIAVVGDRLPAFPDVPTLQESGVPDFEVDSWYAMLVPARTPRPVIDRLNKALNTVLQDAAIRTQLLEQGAEAVGGTPEALGQVIAAELPKWAKLAKDSNIKAN